MSLSLKSLSVVFAAVALGGCATMNHTGSDCVLRQGKEINLPLFKYAKRNDQFNEKCAAGQTAGAFSNMRTADGKPDIRMYALAANLYAAASPETREFIDRTRKETAHERADDAYKYALQSEDGVPNLELMTQVQNVYNASSAAAQPYLEKFLQEDFGLGIDQVNFTVMKAQQPVGCQRVEVTKPDGTKTTGFRCQKK